MQYSRKLSADEAKKNAIMVSKQKLKMFPDLGLEFKIRFGKKNVSAQISAVPSTCTAEGGEECKFFLHLFSDYDFKKNQKATIAKNKMGALELKVSK